MVAVALAEPCQCPGLGPRPISPSNFSPQDTSKSGRVRADLESRILRVRYNLIFFKRSFGLSGQIVAALRRASAASPCPSFTELSVRGGKPAGLCSPAQYHFAAPSVGPRIPGHKASSSLESTCASDQYRDSPTRPASAYYKPSRCVFARP